MIFREEWDALFFHFYFLTAWIADAEMIPFLRDNERCFLGCLGLPRKSNNKAVPAIATTNGFMLSYGCVVV